MSSSVLLIEDDIDLAATVVDYLSLENICCDHAANGSEGLALVNKIEFDVIILDINMPKIDGLTVCKRLREQGVSVPIIMLTARDTLDDKLLGFEAGADDYLVKPFELLELTARLKALTKRSSGQSNKLSMWGVEADFSQKTLTRDGQSIQLSPTGWKLLEVLMRKSPQVVSQEKLYASVWGDERPNSNTLKVHMFKLRKQIDSKFECKLITTIAGQGIAFRG
ncbi:response regulator transcription factor [Vibrio sp. S4M6]|uniref:response regulator transcription factor n=1 Tax=Vibrio sinus TaxID=2946865 RepID=UPI00202A649D|nr:response regulator transcription factor [Vibrio sinus]MCL9780937.1 response regulator transcription factor [Vibrio sinus]